MKLFYVLFHRKLQSMCMCIHVCLRVHVCVCVKVLINEIFCIEFAMVFWPLEPGSP